METEAKAIYRASFFYNDQSDLKVIDEPASLIKTIKDRGIKVAVCTSDSRPCTEQALQTIGIMDMVDLVVCGNDPGSQPKPSPHNALWICSKLGVDPSDAAIVGDSVADICMGKAAGLGLTIGVLSGTSSQRQLEAADHIIPSIRHSLSVLFPSDHREFLTSVSKEKFLSRALVAKSTTPMSRSSFSTFRRAFSSTSGHHDDSLTYDYIIVGAGSAGCVLANRISADENNKVLVLEAGPVDKTWKIHMPAALMYTLFDPTYNWCYWTIPQKHCNNRKMYWPRGRVWGGCSSHNAMVYVRGHALDYDRWSKEGATGWSYAECLPYFKRSQTHNLGEDEYRGSDGPLRVTQGTGENPLHQAFLDAGVQAGYPFTADMNGYQQEGFGYMDRTIWDGRRSNSSNGYLRPVLYRQNLDVTSKALVQRIIFEGKRAVGIEYKEGGLIREVRATKEVILSGGAINTPQILMLSGVGPADHLRELDIPVIANLPGVGQNLQDHLEVYIQQKCKKPITLYRYQWKYPLTMAKTGLEWFLKKTGPAASTHLDTGAFIRSRPGVPHPDIQFHFLPSVVINHGSGLGDCHAFQVHVGPMRQRSRGSVKLNSRDPEEFPIIDANYLGHEEDIIDFRYNVRLAREILSQKAFDEFRDAEIQPGIDVTSDTQIDDFIRNKGDSAYHPSCTAKMGLPDDPMTVVDADCRVLGIDGLRVVDASAMPSVVSGNLNGPVTMFAEKASDIILGRTPLPKSNAPVYKPKTLETQR